MYAGLLALLIITCQDFASIMALKYEPPDPINSQDLTENSRFFYGFQVISIPVFIIVSAMW